MFINRSGKIQKAITLISLALVSLVFTLTISGCENKRNAKGNDSTSGNTLYPPPLTGESIRQIVASSMGDSSQLRDATLAGEGTEKTVDVGVDRPANIEDGSVEATMAVLNQKIMPVLFEYPEVSRITITMFGVKQGVMSDAVAVKTSVNRASASEIDWSFFGPMTMSSMVTEYYIDPGILLNSSAGSDGSTGMYH